MKFAHTGDIRLLDSVVEHYKTIDDVEQWLKSSASEVLPTSFRPISETASITPVFWQQGYLWRITVAGEHMTIDKKEEAGIVKMDNQETLFWYGDAVVDGCSLGHKIELWRRETTTYFDNLNKDMYRPSTGMPTSPVQLGLMI